MDKAGANFFHSLTTIKKKLHARPLICQLPIGAENDLRGVIDLIEEKAHYFEIGNKEENYQTKEIPPDYLKQVREYRQILIETVLEHDEKLALKYLEGKDLSSQEIKTLIRKATLSGKQFPIFCGSSFKNVGVKLLLDGIVNYLPSPLDKGEIKAFSLNNQEEMINISPHSPNLLALAFKVVTDPFGKLTFFRVYSGKITANSYIYNVTKGENERISSRLVRMQADKRQEIGEVGAGDIAAAIGLKHTTTGDTLGEKNNPLLLESINFAEPVISLAIEPKSTRDQDELSKGLRALSEEDPTFHYRYNSETRQMIISGMGELHLEVLVERLKSEFKIEVDVGKPEVAYKETIKNTVEIEHTHKKQTGGAGQFARVKLRFEPNPSKGFEFIDDLKGENIPREYVPSIEEGLIQTFSSGPLLGCPLVDIKATLLDGKSHEVDSSPLAFSLAAAASFRENKEKFQLVLLEPIMQVEVIIPKEYYGNILADLTSRRGEIGKTVEEEIMETCHLQAEIPLTEILGYSTTLRSLTKGRGNYSMKFLNYREVPNYLLEKILKKENH